jgi:aspartate-semialdehyde dehydrogenase
VPVLDGHTACISVQFENKPAQEEILELWRDFKGVPQALNLPSAPKQPIRYREEKDRPQPRLDRNTEAGMAVTVGRLRECPVLDFRFVALSHNALRGAASGGILNAELLHAQGYL